jgi:hypothetical protein
VARYPEAQSRNKETDRRESLFGIAEKLHKEHKARRKLATSSLRRARKSPRRA